MPNPDPQQDASAGKDRSLGRRAATAAGDVLRLLAGEGAALAVQVILLTVALLALAAAPAGDASPEAAAPERLLRLDAGEMIGPPLSATEDLDQAGATETEDISGFGALLSPRVWRNRVVFIWPSLYDTTLLLLAGMLGAVVFACLLVIPALRAQSPGARAVFGLLDEIGLILCCVPVFVAGFLIRLKAPPDNRLLYYALAALALGIGNLTLAEMVQMLRTQLREEIGRPYFGLIDARGFSLWQKVKHRSLPYARAVLLSIRSKVPILFSSVVIIEIILSQNVGGKSVIKKGLGLVAKEAAAAGDGLTLFWVILIVMVWVRLVSLIAETVTYFWLWNPRRQ